MTEHLPSIDYEPPSGPSLFDLWEEGRPAPLPPPLSVADITYRTRLAVLLDAVGPEDRDLVGVGSGNGRFEAHMQSAGWTVLATDAAEAALRHCRARGLTTRRFTLLEDTWSSRHPSVIVADGLFGHLWSPRSGTQHVWSAVAGLGRPGSLALVSNDLSDDDARTDFSVRNSPEARFFRPPSGQFGADAQATGHWIVQHTELYPYLRNGSLRRREIIVARLLVNERREPEHRVQPRVGDLARRQLLNEPSLDPEPTG